MIKALARLSRRQLVTLAVLFCGDVAALAAGFMLVTRQPAPAREAVAEVDQASCQALSAEQLAVHHLAGTTRLEADGSLRFELTGQDTAGRELPRPSDAAWDVLSAAAVALPPAGCGPYPFVRVEVPDSSGPPGTLLLVEVNGIDLRAWGERELDDGELSARARASIYVR
jgi:hypothetical protein